MAVKITRKVAITTILQYAIDNGFDDNDIIEVANKVIDSFTTKKSNKPAINKTYIANVATAKAIHAIVIEDGIDSIDNKWIVTNIDDINTPQKATAVMKVAINEGLFTRVQNGKNISYVIA